MDNMKTDEKESRGRWNGKKENLEGIKRDILEIKSSSFCLFVLISSTDLTK